jgi:hypothetical protein
MAQRGDPRWQLQSIVVMRGGSVRTCRDAAIVARRFGGKPTACDRKANSFRFRQLDPALFSTFRTKSVGDQIRLVYGRLVKELAVRSQRGVASRRGAARVGALESAVAKAAAAAKRLDAGAKNPGETLVRGRYVAVVGHRLGSRAKALTSWYCVDSERDLIVDGPGSEESVTFQCNLLNARRRRRK